MGNILNSIIFTPIKPIYEINNEIKYLNNCKKSIPYMIIENAESNIVIIYSYGNCESISSVKAFCKELSEKIKVSVVMYEYAGYGVLFDSKTKATEHSVKQDVLDITDFVHREYPKRKIIHYGRSIGSGPAIFACFKRPFVDGLIIESGFLSIFKTILHVNFKIWGDVFRNEQIIGNIDVPTLVIHGKNDKIVPFYHAQGLANKCKNLWGTLYLNKGNHNNLTTPPFKSEVFFKIMYFINYV